MAFNVFFSNRLEFLFERLKERLFAPGVPPLSRRLIIVPSPVMKSWLMLRMAQDPDLGVATGIEISYLDASVAVLTGIVSGETGRMLTALELSLAIEFELRALLEERPLLNASDSACWEPLFKYLQLRSAKAQGVSQKSEKRLIWLSEQLARLFLQYGKYGGALLQEWENKNPEEWQARLWRRLFCQKKWNYPYRAFSALSTDVLQRKDVQVHLFAISHFPRLHHQFLSRLSHQIPVAYYQLSPCHAYWHDLKSDEERCRLQKFLQKKGISAKQRMALDEYLRDNNPLLANFGRLGREMAERIEDSEAIVAEEYALTAAALSHPVYDPLVIEDLQATDFEKPLTLLDVIQTDMLLLRNPRSSSKIEVSQEENSIQIHVAHSAMREVQILYDMLLTIVHRHAEEKEPIYPGQILVMAPDIQHYAPYIKMVFSSQESLLRPHVMESVIPAENSLVQVFLHLLELPCGRWEVPPFLQLLRSAWFQKRHQLNPEEVQTVEEWISATDVRWGADLLHRNELLKRDHCQKTMVEESEVGTWEYGIDKLISMLLVDKGGDLSSEVMVVPTQMELMGKWISLLRSLWKELACLHQELTLSIKEWISRLRRLCTAYLIDEDEQAECEEWRFLASAFESFSIAHDKIGDKPTCFGTIKPRLIALLTQPQELYREMDLDAVKFCSLLPMRAIPAQVIVILGMEEGSFPRVDYPSSLDLLHASGKGDYVPSQVDYDRFLFLETLLSSRRYFLILYQGYGVDGKERPPALPVTELLSYLDQACLVGDGLPSQTCVFKHPFHPFDRSYFDPTSQVCSHSQIYYMAAEASQYACRTADAQFIPSFVAESSLPPVVEGKTVRIHVKDLIAFAKNPLKTYFNKTLGIYLKGREEATVKESEDFLLSPLEEYRLKHLSLKYSFNHLMRIAESEGRLPVGPFKPASIQKLQTEIEIFHTTLNEQGITPQDLFELTFTEECSTLTHPSSTHWEVPVLKLPFGGGEVEIIGTLPNLSPQGIVAYIKDEKVDLIKIWPQFLLFSCVCQRDQLPVKNNLVIIKGRSGNIKSSFSLDPYQKLTEYLEYYFSALEHPSPLLPEWISPLLNQNSAACVVALKESLTHPFSRMYNIYLDWAMREALFPLDEQLVVHWKPRAENLFGDIYRHWCPEKKKLPVSGHGG